MNVYGFKVTDINGNESLLTEYEGKVLLIVNTASKCGFTPQYEQLEEMYKKYQRDGLMVLGFPCNQFKNQEPDGEEEIKAFCTAKYGVTFPMFAKVEVKGETAHPLFRYLIQQQGFQGFDKLHPLAEKLDEILSAEDVNYKNSDDIKWNFTKFLVDKDGTVVARFEPTADMEQVEQKIRELI